MTDLKSVRFRFLFILLITGAGFLFVNQFGCFSFDRLPNTLPPYPPSTVINDLKWDVSTLRRVAPGSDLWATTWADDNQLYSAWGDGGGFGGTNKAGRVTIGVARIAGGPLNLKAVNIWGGENALAKATFQGKPTGLLSIKGNLYMGVVGQENWLRWKIVRSEDHGRTWIFSNSSKKYWDFDEPDGAFSDTTFLNFGRDYESARDDYVYGYSQDHRVQKTCYDIAMFRVRKEKLMEKNAYEYFAGLDSMNGPLWTKDIKKRKPVFTNPNGVGWGTRVIYNRAIKRYLLTTWHNWDGSWGIFDAPEPWGPWTTVAYYEQWLDDVPKFGFDFPQKWLSDDGKTMWLVFSGLGKYDAFCLIKAKLFLSM